MIRHEPNTTNNRWLAAAVALFIALIVFSILSVGGLIEWFNRDNPGKAARTSIGTLPARVQTWQHPPALRRDVEAQAIARIDGYAWIDRGAGVVRIPVERAMQLLARGPATQENKP